jgi:peptidase E
VLFLPTGAKDDPGYAAQAEASLRSAGAGGFEALFLTKNPSPKAVDLAVSQADVVYFGGGAASQIVKHGDRYGLSGLLAAASSRGAVLAGVSGGAIALFDGGAGAYNGYRPLPGWGLAPGSILPHFHPGEELGAAGWFSGDASRVLYGIKDGAALVWDGHRTMANGEVWRLTRDEAGVRCQPLLDP